MKRYPGYLKARNEWLEYQPEPHRCDKCGARHRLQVDHIQPKRKRPDLACEPSNFQLLCWDCHAFKGQLEGAETYDNDRFLAGDYD